MTSRLQLPSEFFDRTSAMMLRQPEPQYLYSQLVFMADASAELRRMEAVGLTPERAISDVGASIPMFSMFQAIIAGQLPYSEAIVVSDELAPGKTGHTIRMNRPVFNGGGYTRAARRYGTGMTTSTTPLTLSAEQVSITIERQQGPYASSGSEVQPIPIYRLDAEHSIHSAVQYAGLHLYRDRIKLIDSVYRDLYDAGSAILYPADPSNALAATPATSATQDAAAFPTTVAGTRGMDFETLMRMKTKLQQLNIPTFSNGQYIAILNPQQALQLSLDPDFNRTTVFTPALNTVNPLSASLIKSINGVDVYVSNTNNTDASTVSGLTINHGCMFGPQAIGRASAGPARPAVSSADDYGEQALVIWIAYEGEALLDNRFIVNVHSN